MAHFINVCLLSHVLQSYLVYIPQYISKFIKIILIRIQNLKIKFLVCQVTLVLYIVLVGFNNVWGRDIKKTVYNIVTR